MLKSMLRKHVSSIRERDKALILDVIRQFGPLSRVEIHELTHLRPSTISQLTRELIHEDKILEAGFSDNPMGRKQILLEMNEEAGVIIALDFDAETVTSAALNCRPALIGPVISEPTETSQGVEGLLSQLFRCARQAMSSAGNTAKFLGIGVGDPSLVDTNQGCAVLSSTIEFWRDVPVRQRFENEFGLQCVVDNSTRTRTMAERTLGAGHRADDFIFVVYGWGVGAGIFSGGRIIQGSTWAAGEFGHTHVSETAAPCRCGSFGCLEALAGIGALEANIKKALRRGASSQCLAMAGGEADKISGWQVLEACRLGDKMSTALVEEMATYLGLGLANLVNLFNPSLIVLDGRLELAGDLVLEQIIRTVRRQALSYSARSLKFRFADLGHEAGLLGAGLLMLDVLFEVPAIKPPRFLIDRSLIRNDSPSASVRTRREKASPEETLLIGSN
jgi:N-acetylglucosamine repressor